MIAHHRDKLLHRGIGGHGEDVGTRRHGFAYRFVSEFHHRLNQLAVALLKNALFAPRLNQGVHGLGGILGCVGLMRLGQGGHRQAEAQHQGNREHQIKQHPQQSDK